MVEQNINNALGFEETLNKGEAFFLKYKTAIIACVAAVVVIVAGIILYKNYVVEPRENEASTLLAKGQEYFQNEQFDVALNGDSLGYAGFIKIADEKSSTAAGNLANLYAGLCYANLEKWQEAADYIEKFDGSDDAMISPAAIALHFSRNPHIRRLRLNTPFPALHPGHPFAL